MDKLILGGIILSFIGTTICQNVTEGPQKVEVKKKCRNFLGPRRKALEVTRNTGETLQISLCSEMVKSYSGLCRTHGQPGGLCCRACAKYITDMNCLDGIDAPSTVAQYSEVFTTCSDYVSADPCRCAKSDVKEQCCLSCRTIDTTALGCNCTNIFNPWLRPAYVISLTIIYMKTSRFSDILWLLSDHFIETCTELADWFPGFCGGPAYHEIHTSLCCKTCASVDSACIDNLYWKTNATLETVISRNVTLENATLQNVTSANVTSENVTSENVTVQNVTCHNCNCHEIRRKSEELMRLVCSTNTSGINLDLGARQACCHQCSRLGFEKPADITKDTQLKAFADTHFIQLL